MIDRTIYLLKIKPLVDKLVAILLFIGLFPLVFLLMVTLFFANGGSVFFVQTRIGKEEKEFKLLKFKTMKASTKDKGVQRTTRIGRLLRKVSLDELPQLINVLKGEMSIIGPRPLLPEYLEYYTKEEKRRHAVLPGITGWAQVRGRNQSSWDKRMRDDLFYVDSVSPSLDLKIILLTVKQLFQFTQADFETQKQETFIEYAGKR